MSPVYLWGILIAILIGCELLTGTFYLLMIAIGSLAGLVCAFLDFSVTVQLAAAAIACVALTSLWHYKNFKNPKAAIYSKNKDALIDIGERVEVSHWLPNHTTQIRYRGADWTAVWIGEGEPRTGTCVIQGMRGNQLELAALSTS